MAAAEVIQQEIYEILKHVKKIHKDRLYLDYDKEADTMYVSFEKPQMADDSELLADGSILRFEDGEIVGLTITNYSKRNF